MNHGIPYQGSKSKIIEDIGYLFPRAKNFYDLFGGGFSVTHFMSTVRRNHFDNFHFNEIRPGLIEFIQDAIAGKYNTKTFKMPWVSSSEFHARKESDIFIKIIWSFGNNGESYLFGPDIEPYKRSMHQCVVFNEFDEIAKTVTGFDKWPIEINQTGRRLFIANRIEWFRKTKRIPAILHKFIPDLKKTYETHLQQLQKLEQLWQLERLERLERLQHITKNKISFTNLDYRKVKIENDSILYCDIPYFGTVEYDKNKNFDHKEFFEWAAHNPNPVFISEYNIQDSRFKLIKSINVKSTMSSKGSTSAVEKLYVNEAAFKRLQP